MRQILVGLAVAMLWCGAASAENWSKIRCEDPEVIDFIKLQLKTMKFEGGQPIAPYLGNNSTLKATTVSAQKDRFVCNVHVAFTYVGNTQKIRGKFVFREFSGDRASVSFIPF